MNSEEYKLYTEIQSLRLRLLARLEEVEVKLKDLDSQQIFRSSSTGNYPKIIPKTNESQRQKYYKK